MSSTIYLQDVVDDVLRFGDLLPVLKSAGSSQEPALTIANLVMAEMCASVYNWKWNSFNPAPFCVISWQNDYASSITNLGWLENAVLIDINSTQIPKRKWKMEVVKDLQPTSDSYGRPFQVCWLENRTLQYGTWGSGATLPNINNSGQTNPGPNAVYTQPLGSATTPSNPITQIQDPNGNFLILTTFGVCGAIVPTFPAANAAPGTQVTDGTCIWTVVDPRGQGFRLQLIPSQAGVVWQIIMRAQYKPVRFTSLSQTIDPIPDDYERYFRQGFTAYCYQRSPEGSVRRKFDTEYTLWLKNMQEAGGQAERETESYGAYPDSDLMSNYWWNPGPAWPYGF